VKQPTKKTDLRAGYVLRRGMQAATLSGLRRIGCLRNRKMKVACILEQDTYKPGDPPPEGYLAWHEWAEVQRKAGIKQVQCGRCGLWKTP